jgi:hypothetical protein
VAVRVAAEEVEEVEDEEKEEEEEEDEKEEEEAAAADQSVTLGSHRAFDQLTPVQSAKVWLSE